MNARTHLVLGLARSGTSLSRYLLAQGISVALHDDNPTVFERPEVTTLFQAGARRWDGSAQGVEVAIASPGIPQEARVLQRLRAEHVRIIDEVEYVYSVVGPRIVAVTGTNGKSTTTALIGEMLKADGRNCFYGGNLAPGIPFSAALLDATRDWYVVEVSSFQLERCDRFAPKVGVLLNITPDHLNRHGSFARYRNVKLSLFRNQAAGDSAVVNADDPNISAGPGPGQNAARSGGPQVYRFSLTDPGAEARLEAGQLVFRGEPVVSAGRVRLRGRHNLANALAALAAARALDVKPASIAHVLSTFAGLEHRLELVAEAGGVKYFNNSMCTNPAAAIQSLQAFDAPVILITGGREKDLPIDDYLVAIARQARAALLVGENRRRLRSRLAELGYQSAQVADSLAEAVRLAEEMGRPGDVVLFSPGFASFDQYADFQERGRAFKDAVRENVG